MEDLGDAPPVPEGPLPREPAPPKQPLWLRRPDRPGRPAVWPLLLVVLAAGAAFLLQHFRPEEKAARKPPSFAEATEGMAGRSLGEGRPPEAGAVSEIPEAEGATRLSSPKSDGAPSRDSDPNAPGSLRPAPPAPDSSPGRWVAYEEPRLRAADVVRSLLAVAGLVGLFAILSKRRRAWLVPPPARAPRTGWGIVELVQGLMLAVAVVMVLGNELVRTLFRESIAGSSFTVLVMYACLAAAIVALTAPHAATTSDKDGQDTQDGERTSASSAEPQTSCESCQSLLKAVVRPLGLSLEGARTDALRGLAGGAIAFPVALAAAFFAGVLSSCLGIEPPVHPMIELAGTTASRLDLVVIFASGVIVAPLAEEFLFRGFIFASLRDRAGLAAGIVASSLLFSVVHAGLPTQAATLVLGAAFCLLYERTGTLVAPVVAHAYFNLAMLSMTLLQRFDL